MNFTQKIASIQKHTISLLVLVAFFQLVNIHFNDLKTNNESVKSQKETTVSRFEKNFFSNPSINQAYDDCEESEIKESKKKYSLLHEINSMLSVLSYTEHDTIGVDFLKNCYYKKNNLYLLFCNLKYHLI